MTQSERPYGSGLDRAAPSAHSAPSAATPPSDGPCEFCRAPGLVGAHPRQPVSICLCQKHWDELAQPGYHFETYHLIYPLLMAALAVIFYPLVARFF